MRDERIAVLALQETHLNTTREQDIGTLFESSIQLISSPDPDNPTGARGIAVVINKKLVRYEQIQHVEIVPGRALEVTIPWAQSDNLRLLALYAPNNTGEQRTFWDTLSSTYTNDRPKPDIIIGDLNFVEDALDRIPSRPDNDDTTEAAQTFLHACNAVDG